MCRTFRRKYGSLNLAEFLMYLTQIVEKGENKQDFINSLKNLWFKRHIVKIMDSTNK